MNKTTKYNPATEEDLMTFEEAAEFLCVSKSTLYRMLDNNAIHGRKVGRQWRFTQSDLQKYLHRDSEQIIVESISIDDIDILTDIIKQTAKKLHLSIPEIARESTTQEKIHYFADNLVSVSIRMKSSDIHLLPEKDRMVIKERVNGMLTEICSIPSNTAQAVINRFKAMADCSIEEKQTPQDGRIICKVDNITYDLRVAFISTLYGESMTAGVLHNGQTKFTLDDMNLMDDDLNRLRSWMKSPNGIIIFSGPSGSGKTTTLYAALRERTSPNTKTISIEDPIAYELENVTQVPINTRIGLSIPSALRAIMRHDPDIIMLTDIRDRETASLMVQCSLTGHLVISQLGTASCQQSINMFNEFGIEKYLISEALTGIVNQKLVRRICPACKVKAFIDTDKISEIREIANNGGYQLPVDVSFWRGEGCAECNGSGYRNRAGIYALLEFTPAIREAITSGMQYEKIQEIAIKENMHTMAADGIRKVAAGITTIEELIFKEII